MLTSTDVEEVEDVHQILAGKNQWRRISSVWRWTGSAGSRGLEKGGQALCPKSSCFSPHPKSKANRDADDYDHDRRRSSYAVIFTYQSTDPSYQSISATNTSHIRLHHPPSAPPPSLTSTTSKMSISDSAPAAAAPSERDQVLEQYRAKIREHREIEARLKRMREDVKGLVARYQKTEDDLTALQSVGQIIGDVLKRLDNDRFIVKASSGPRYVVGCRSRLNYEKLKPGTRVALDMTTLTIMRILPREVDPTVFHMQNTEDEGENGKKVSFSDIGGLNEQIRELREVIELPLTNPELFIRVGIKVSRRIEDL